LGTAKEGAALEILGETPAPVKMKIGSLDRVFQFKPIVVRGLTMDLNISGPFLQQHGIDQLHSRGCLLVQGREVRLLCADGEPVERCMEMLVTSNVYTEKEVHVGPYTMAEFPVKIAAVMEGQMPAAQGIMVGDEEFMERTKLHPYRRHITGCTEAGYSVATVMNTTDTEKIIPAGMKYGIYALLPSQEVSINSLGPSTDAVINENEIIDNGKTWSDEKKDKWLTAEFRLKESPFLQPIGQLKAALRVLRKHWDIFSIDGSFGKTHLVKHDIHTEPGPPIKERFRPVNPAMEASLKEQLEAWMKHDVIEESNSPWSFALVAVRKKNGKTRWCVDYRKLNAITRKDSFPLPLIEDNLARLAESTVFSGIDGMGAFHVVEMEKEARPKTAFATPWGTYHFKRMPFGLSNGPATYSRLMQLALQGIPTSIALPYLDDTIIHTRNIDSHMAALSTVLKAHEDAGLKLQPSKCQLFRAQIEYLGHQVSKDGIAPVEDYVKIVREWPTPETRSQVRAFLGKVGYYRRFIAGFATLDRKSVV
jgi:hypothetical protein